jgi:hypothetical protein
MLLLLLRLLLLLLLPHITPHTFTVLLIHAPHHALDPPEHLTSCPNTAQP